MRKKSLTWILVIAMVLSMLISVPITVSAATLLGNGSELFYDDFESYTENTYPSSFTQKYNGTDDVNQKVITTSTFNGSTGKVFQLEGARNWSSEQYRSLPETLPDNIVIDAYIKPVTSSRNAELSLRTFSVGTWGTRISSVWFEGDGTIVAVQYGNDNNRIYVGSYTVGNWYRVTLDNNMIDKTYDVYIDGVLTTSDIPMNPLDTPTTLSLIAHNVTTSMAYFDNVGLYTVLPDFEAIDDIAPALTAGSVSRISDAEATITFTSDEAGKYYYEVTESGAGAPVIDTSTPGTVCDTNEQTISLNSLAAGAKDIYIVVKDANDNVSDELLMEIPAYIPPVPPTASSVVITGTPSVGEMITGGYTYNPGSVSDEGSSTFRWLQVSGTPSLLGHPYLLYTTNNTGVVGNSSDGPTNPTRFTVTGTTHVAKISNYHYGYGYVSGTISLVDENSTVYGPWSTASDGYWSAYPDIELPAGTYTVIDSEPGSWSFNNESGNAGMTEIVGYTVITGAEAQTYTLQAADVGHRIIFEVTPEDADGNRGEASLSDVFGPVETPVDTDGDGVPDHIDNAPLQPNPDQSDIDNDGIGDVADNAPSVYNPDQLDTDGDGVGDVVDRNTVIIGTLSGGTITANPTTAISGTTINLTITPAPGKRLKAGTLNYNDGTDHDITGTSFIMPGSGVTVTAEFESIPTSGGSSASPKYPVTDANKDTQAGGQTKLSKERAEAGDTVIITITPDKGYENSKPVVLDNNKKSLAITDNGDGTFSFKMPAGRVSVETKFTKIDYFDDVNEDDWFDEASWYCAAHGLMQGTGNRQFDGHMGTNRAMLVTVLYRLANSTDDLESIFDDVESGKWYSEAIGWAAHNKIVEGYGNGKFGPDDTLTREQMISVLYRYSMFMKYDVSKLNSLNTFTDADAISEWALQAMKWAAGNGIMEGIGNDLISPETGATRAQFAAMMQRYITTFIK